MEAFLQQVWADETLFFRTIPRDVLFHCIKPYLNPWDYHPLDQILTWGKQPRVPPKNELVITSTMDAFSHQQINLAVRCIAQWPDRPDILSFWRADLSPGFITLVYGAVSQDNWLVLWVNREKTFPGHQYMEFWRLDTVRPTFHHRILFDNMGMYRMRLAAGRLYLLSNVYRLYIVPLVDVTSFDYIATEGGRDCSSLSVNMVVDPRSGDPLFLRGQEIRRLNKMTYQMTSYLITTIPERDHYRVTINQAGVLQINTSDMTWTLSP